LGSAPCVNHTIDLDWMDEQGWQAGVLKSSRGIGGMSSRGRAAPHEDQQAIFFGQQFIGPADGPGKNPKALAR
jgi:hypothetical protein